jgi:hypothetical protein
VWCGGSKGCGAHGRQSIRVSAYQLTQRVDHLIGPRDVATCTSTDHPVDVGALLTRNVPAQQDGHPAAQGLGNRAGTGLGHYYVGRSHEVGHVGDITVNVHGATGGSAQGTQPRRGTMISPADDHQLNGKASTSNRACFVVEWPRSLGAPTDEDALLRRVEA